MLPRLWEKTPYWLCENPDSQPSPVVALHIVLACLSLYPAQSYET